MLKSLKSRGLAAGFMISIFILLLAYYAQVLLQDNISYSKDKGVKIDQHHLFIDELVQPVNRLEISLYQFLLSLESVDREDAFQHIAELQARVPLTRQHIMTNDNPELAVRMKAFIQHQEQLIDQVTKLLELTDQQRFPSMQLIFERMNPVISTFNANIQIIENLIHDAHSNTPQPQLRELVHQLKYAWSQSQNNTRLLLTSRTGLFGNADTAIQLLENNNQQYNAELDNLLQQLDALSRNEINDLELTHSVDQLSQALQARLQTLNMLKKGLALNDWRRDKFIMQTQIKPRFDALIEEIARMEQLITQQASHNLGHSQYASEQLSSFLWLLCFLFMALILATYLVFEYWIRIPIETIAKAMHSEASHITPQPLKHTGAREIDYLIDAFDMMRAQIRLRQQRIASILHNAGEGIILINNSQRIDTFNPAAERIFQVTEQQVLDQHFLTLFDQDNSETLDKIIANLDNLEDKNHQYLCSGVRPDGTQFPVDLTVSNMELDDQLYNILMLRDASDRIQNEFDLNQARLDAEAMQELLVEQVQQLDASLSQLRQTQTQLVEAEKMASLAGLVAGVAHEINTPIGIGVTASSHLESELQLLQQKFTDESLAAEDLSEYISDATTATQIIQNNLQQAATLIRGFKQVAVDQSSEEMRSFNLLEYLQEIILNLHPKLKKTRHQVRLDVDENITPYSVPGALSQIITNLIINSLTHAFADDAAGHIDIAARLEGNTIEMRYQDDGKGMQEQTRERIFEPFFTTRRGSGGSGLGMHITYNLVTATLQGNIECSSTPGQGTRFIIRFPASTEELKQLHNMGA